jgi:hypothetical protein
VRRILRTPDTDDLRAFVRDAVLNETDTSARGAAAIGFLEVHRVLGDTPAAQPEVRAYADRLNSPSRQTRADAVSEIEQKDPLPR